METSKLTFKNRRLPIIDGAYMQNETEIVTTDLEVWIKVKKVLHTPGVYSLGVKTGERDDFPCFTEDLTKAGNISVTTFNKLFDLIPFLGEDELRPIFDGIFLTNSEAVATNAHILKIIPFINPWDNDIIFDPRPWKTKYNYLCKEFGTTSLSFAQGEKYASISCPDWELIFRVIDGKYPNYNAFLPDAKDYKTCVQIPTDQILKEIKPLVKQFGCTNLNTGIINLEAKTITCSDIDCNIERTYPITVTEQPAKKCKSLIMPTYMENKPDMFGINIPLLQSTGTSKVFLDKPNRACILEHEPIVPLKNEAMKTKKEQKVTAKVTDAANKYLIVNYSEKALAVFGDTKPIKNQLKELGARFNPYLTKDGVKTPGWICSKKKEADLRKVLA
jgi:hypothetical protein